MPKIFPLPDVTNEATILKDFTNAGWKLEHNGYRHFFRQEGTGKVHLVPDWVAELVSTAFQQGQESVQGQVKQALGIKG